LPRSSSSTTSPTPRVRVPQLVAQLVAPLVVDYLDYAARPGASARRAARHRLLRLCRASGCLGTSHGSSRGSSRRSSSTSSARRASGCLGTSRGSSRGSLLTSSPTLRVRVLRHVARHVVRLVVDYFTYAAHSVPRHVARLVTRLVVDYFDYAARPGASARRVARHTARRSARRRLLRLRRASRCLSTSRDSSRRSSSTPSPTPRVRVLRTSRSLSSTTSPTLRVRVPRHVARLVTRLVVDYFDYAARPGASERRAARHTACRAARRRLLSLHRASGFLGTSRGSSRRSSSTTLTTTNVLVPWHVVRLVTRLVAPLVVGFFAYTMRPCASAHRATHHRLLRVAPLVVDFFAYAVRPGALAHRVARCRLLHLRRASGCLGTSHGSSRGSSRRSSLTTLSTPRVRVPRHIVWLITRLAVDYFAYATRPGASARRVARRVARHAAHRRLLRAPRLRLVATLALLQPHRVSRLLVSWQHWLSFEHAARCCDVVFCRITSTIHLD
jgi:hypothetical protein